MNQTNLSRRQLQTLRTLFQVCDTDDIKVLSGVRGSGKAALFQKLEEFLVTNGISPDHIIDLNLEHILWDTSSDSRQLQTILQRRLASRSARYYVFLKQVNFINGWESTIHALKKQYDIRFFLSASCADWHTDAFQALFGDKYVEFPIYPLSFSEYTEACSPRSFHSIEALFTQYLQYGSLLPVNLALVDDRVARSISTGIYYTILANDLMRHNTIKDMPMFERLTQYMMRNIGVLGSPKSISDHFASIGYKIASDTIANYLAALENSYIFYKIPRYDIFAQRELKSRSKHYIVDTGLRHGLTNSYDDVGYELENTVLFELLSRGYQVQIGKIGKGELDFIATIDGRTEFYQVCRTISSKDDFFEREYKPLLQVKSPHSRKMILSMDKVLPEPHDGIEYKNLLSFLCEK